MSKKNINNGNLLTKTGFDCHGGRRAGFGMLFDDYGDESSPYFPKCQSVRVKLPNDDIPPEDLNGPVITYFAKPANEGESASKYNIFAK